MIPPMPRTLRGESPWPLRSVGSTPALPSAGTVDVEAWCDASGVAVRPEYGRCMPDRRQGSSFTAWVWPLVTAVVMLAAAAMLSRVGFSAMIANYDGMLSALNLVTIGSWCGSAVLLLITLPTATLVHEMLRDD
jgi:hypothetical protein